MRFSEKHKTAFAKQCISAVCALLLTVSALPISKTDTSANALDLGYMLYDASVSSLANKTFAEKNGKEWQGEYIDPANLTSAEHIFVYSNHNELNSSQSSYREEIPADAFLDKEATNTLGRSVLMDWIGDNEHVAVIAIDNYNNTGYDLFYELDFETGVWYQTLNTKPDQTNRNVKTNTKALDIETGDLMINYNAYSDTTSTAFISGLDWVYNRPDMTVPLNRIDANPENGYDTITVRYYDNEKSPETNMAYAFDAKYVRIGNTWLNIDDEERDRLDSGPTYGTECKNRQWIASDGKIGDVVTITSYYNNAIYKQRSNYATDDAEKTASVTITLTENNQKLPVGYGEFLIYNETAGVYETVSTTDNIGAYESTMLTDYTRFLKETQSERNQLEKMKPLHPTNYDRRTIYNRPDRLILNDTTYAALSTVEYVDETTYSACELLNMYTTDPTEALENTKQGIVNGTLIPDEIIQHEVVTPAYAKSTWEIIPANHDLLLTLLSTTVVNARTDNMESLSTDEEVKTLKTNINNKTANVKNDYASPFYQSVMKFTKDDTKMMYAYTMENFDITGVDYDVNQDGVFNVADIIMEQKYLHGYYNGTDAYKLTNFAAADAHKNGKGNIFDLALMKRALLQNR